MAWTTLVLLKEPFQNTILATLGLNLPTPKVFAKNYKMKIIFVEDFVVDISLVLSTTWKKVFSNSFLVLKQLIFHNQQNSYML